MQGIHIFRGCKLSYIILTYSHFGTIGCYFLQEPLLLLLFLHHYFSKADFRQSLEALLSQPIRGINPLAFEPIFRLNGGKAVHPQF